MSNHESEKKIMWYSLAFMAFPLCGDSEMS